MNFQCRFYFQILIWCRIPTLFRGFNGWQHPLSFEGSRKLRPRKKKTNHKLNCKQQSAKSLACCGSNGIPTISTNKLKSKDPIEIKCSKMAKLFGRPSKVQLEPKEWLEVRTPGTQRCTLHNALPHARGPVSPCHSSQVFLNPHSLERLE